MVTLIPSHRPVQTELDDININSVPLINVCSELIQDMEFTVQHTVLNVLDTASLINVSLVSLKSIRFTMLSNQAGNNSDWSTAVTVRLRYLECALTSSVSCIYNVALLILFSSAAMLSGFKINELNHLSRKFWFQTVLSHFSLCIALPGIVIPKSSVILNAYSIVFIGYYLSGVAQDDVVRAVRNVYDRHRESLKTAMKESIHNDERLFQSQVEPIFQSVDRQLPHVRTLGDLTTLNNDVNTEFPQMRLFRAAVSEGSRQHYQQLFQDRFRGVIDRLSNYFNRQQHN